MAQQEPFYAGIDGGGSKTLAVVVDAAGHECGRGTGGSANYAAIGIERAVASIYTAVAAATDAAGGTLPLRAAWIGLAGVDRPADHRALLPRLRDLAETLRLTNDAELILGALDDAVGVAVICGTGSIALGRDARGGTTRAGGWGHIIGDEGSGYDLGRACLQAVSRAADGRGQNTVLLDLLRREWDLKEPSDMIGHVYPQGDKKQIARLSALVCSAARDGDAVAGAIVARAADELALGIMTVGGKLHFPDALPLALGGGLLVHEAELREMVLERIRRQRPLARVAVVAHPAETAARAAIHLPGAGAEET